MFMKTFEEKWTAWLDGELSGDELAEFEASLPDKAAAEAEKRDAHKLGAFLKEQLPHRAMGNEEFFHHQLRERIAADARAANLPDESRCETRLLANRPAGLGGRHLSRDFLRLHTLRPAGEESNRSIAVSHPDPERAGRSRVRPGRDDLDV